MCVAAGVVGPGAIADWMQEPLSTVSANLYDDLYVDKDRRSMGVKQQLVSPCTITGSGRQ